MTPFVLNENDEAIIKSVLEKTYPLMKNGRILR